MQTTSWAFNGLENYHKQKWCSRENLQRRTALVSLFPSVSTTKGNWRVLLMSKMQHVRDKKNTFISGVSVIPHHTVHTHTHTQRKGERDRERLYFCWNCHSIKPVIAIQSPEKRSKTSVKVWNNSQFYTCVSDGLKHFLSFRITEAPSLQINKTWKVTAQLINALNSISQTIEGTFSVV